MPSIDILALVDPTYDSAVTDFENDIIWGYNTPYSWRVDSVNQFGTTTGDTWGFTSITFDPPIATWENLPGKTLGPLTSGVAGTDYRWTGSNALNTVKYILVAKDMSIYYAEVY